MSERGFEQELVGRVLVRRARNATHASLFFLYHFQSTGSDALDEKLAQDRDAALERVRALIDGVHLPEEVAAAALAESPLLGTEVAGRARLGVFARLRGLLLEPAAPAGVTLEQAVEHWAKQIWRPLQLARAPVSAASVDDLVQRLQCFLTLSRSHNGRDPVDWITTGIARLMARNAALLCGLLITAFVYFKLEAVHSLVANMPWRALAFPFGLVLSGLILLTAMNRSPSLHIGKEAFWRVAYPALPPEGSLDLVGCGKQIGTLIGKAEALKLGTLLGWLLLSGLAFGELIEVKDFERTQKTLFLLNSLCVLKLIGLHWLDHWDFLDQRPIRLFGLGIVLLLLGLLLSGYWGQLQLWACGLPLIYLIAWAWDAKRQRRFTWARTVGSGFAALLFFSLLIGAKTRERQVWGASAHREKRQSREAATESSGVERVPAGKWPMGSDPVVLLAASGGGSRAAVYAGYVLERLHRDLPEVAENLQAISSVSGGSLASASYISLRKQLHEGRGTSFWPTEPEDLGAHCENASTGLKDGELVRAVGTDFLYATLKGALVPTQGRGEAIENSFSKDAKIGNLSISGLAHDWLKESGSGVPFPLPVFNSCTLDAHAVVISPLARDYYLNPPSDSQQRSKQRRAWYGMAEQDRFTWVFDRDAVLALSDLNSSYDPSVAEAVRASANFPFGFPLVDVRTDAPYGDGTQREVRLTDGGVLSNSGLWTLFQLMTGPGLGESEPRKLTDVLATRGVLLLIVDASRMPEYADDRRDLLTLYGAISDQAPIAQNLHARMFDVLAKLYGRRLEIVQIDLVPTPEDNVLTTWALDRVSRAKLRSSFCRVWYPHSAEASAALPVQPGSPKGIREEIRQRWQRLKRAQADSQARSECMHPPAFTRPPLD
jgi:hypothetical protein